MDNQYKVEFNRKEDWYVIEDDCSVIDIETGNDVFHGRLVDCFAFICLKEKGCI